MKFLIEIDTNKHIVGEGPENPFGDSTGEEVARILHVLAERIEPLKYPTCRDQDDPFLLRDAHGYEVGLAYFREE